MYMHKITPPENYRYSAPVKNPPEHSLVSLGEDVFKWTAQNSRWDYKSQAGLNDAAFSASEDSFVRAGWSDQFGLSLSFPDGFAFSSLPDRAFGVCGSKWIANFTYDPEMRFYGMGEKNNGFEKTGIQTKFWNTDVWADFDLHAMEHGVTDPMYAGIPYLLLVHPGGCVGILVDNPYAVTMLLGAKEEVGKLLECDPQDNFQFAIGSSGGTPVFYFICGKTVDDVTCKLHRLSGTAPRPPLWSLGHHQCRWGYESLEHLEELDRKFEQYRIPCDGLWLDIDYMEQFKVFTCNSDLFEDCESRLEQLHRRDRRIVPILDPGVKQEQGYPVYESGLEQNVYCRTPEGDVYTGYVWPGRTAFPDFSLPEVRDWWAEKVAGFSKLGFDGYWLDMNDPSTGSAELDDMRFNHGQDDHAAYHNQYALGMQMATQKGLIKAYPNRRPFLISRSGSLGTGRCSAIWTGDNYANEHHMRKSVEISLNLSLSGISFNGPDVPGFGGEPDAELAELWYKQGFLFPFLRNHSGFSFGEREPWRFADGTRKIITHYIRLRYKLMPYLYSLFVEHEKTGRPVMRPIFYEASEEFRMFERTSDEFMIGSSILQAPLGRKGETDRAVVLPIGRWFDAMNGSWVAGGKHIVSAERSATPFYIRSGSVIPMLPGERETQEKDLCNVELHCFVSPGETVHWLYEADDGESFGYRCGEQTVLSLTVSCSDDELTLTVNSFHNGYRPLTVVPVLYQKFSRVVLRRNHTDTLLSLHPDQLRLTGNMLEIWRSSTLEIK